MRKFNTLTILITAFVFFMTNLVMRWFENLSFSKMDAWDFVFALLTKQSFYVLFLIVVILISNETIRIVNNWICHKLFRKNKFIQIAQVLKFFSVISNYTIWFIVLLMFWVGLILNLQLVIWESQSFINYHATFVNVIFVTLQPNGRFVTETINLNLLLLVICIKLYVAIVIYLKIITRICFEFTAVMQVELVKTPGFDEVSTETIKTNEKQTKIINHFLQMWDEIFAKIKVNKLTLIRNAKKAYVPPKSYSCIKNIRLGE